MYNKNAFIGSVSNDRSPGPTLLVYAISLLATLNARKVLRPISTGGGNRTVDRTLSLRHLPSSPVSQVKIIIIMSSSFPFFKKFSCPAPLFFLFFIYYSLSVQTYPSKLILSKNCIKRKFMKIFVK